MKVLGVIGLIDGGETDWKLISIDIRDSEANKLNSLEESRNKTENAFQI